MTKREITTLNITYHGMSTDVHVPLSARTSDRDLKRIAVELVRSGEVPGMHISNLAENTFRNYVVDRFQLPAGGQRVYLRPKVPFG